MTASAYVAVLKGNISERSICPGGWWGPNQPPPPPVGPQDPEKPGLNRVKGLL